jgi:N4-gp56 family major capsid protein
MADTASATGLQVQRWDDKFFREHLAQNRFASMMGRSSNAIIQVNEELGTKKGKSITFSLVNKLTNAAVTGSSTLEGNEEALETRSFEVTVDKYRNAVRVPEIDEQYSAISLRDAGREALMDWMMELDRDAVIDALGSINGVLYASATEAQKDAWLVDNADRALFGAVLSNNAANDHSAALANIDNTADQLDTGAISLMKRLAKTADPKIRPVRVNKSTNQWWYVLVCGSLTFRDLKSDTVIQQANREALQRGKSNPLFADGDLMWDGVIIKEVEDIPTYTGVGAGGIDVQPVYMLGAQAVGWAIAKRTWSKTEEFDYGDKQGVSVNEIRGIEKMKFGSGTGDTDDLKDHGVLTGYFAAVADS